MRCEQWFEAVSALVDGEDPGVDPHLVEAHLAGCASCRARRRQLEALRRPLRVGPAEAQPDLSGRIAKLNAVADRASRWVLVRVLLALVAAYIVVLSLRALVLADQAGASIHAARHLGTFTLAYGAGLLVIVARPARARTMLPVSLTLAIALVLSAAVDIVDGETPFSGEALHLPEILSVLLVWLLAAPALHRRDEAGRQRLAVPPSLQVVEDAGEPGETDSGSRAG